MSSLPFSAVEQFSSLLTQTSRGCEAGVVGQGTLLSIDGNDIEHARCDEKTRATIAIISRAIAAVNPCVEAVEREASVGSRSLNTAIDRRLD